MKYISSWICLFLLSFPLLLHAQCDGFWQSGYGRPGVFSVPKAMTVDPSGTYLYVGDPEQFGGDPDIEKVGRWDGENWKGLGDFVCTSCGSGSVEALAVDDQGNLFIGGFFEGVTDASGTFTPSKNVIKWNTSTGSFESLGFGVEAIRVYALAWRNDTLFAGGAITQAKNTNGDIPVNNIALYDESAQSWSAMGSGIESFNLSSDDNGDVLALDFATTGELIVGGKFSKINGNTQVYSTAQWTPSAGWSALGDGVRQINDASTPVTYFPAIVEDFAVDDASGTIYAVGIMGPFYGAGSGLASIGGTGAASWVYNTGLGNLPSGGRWFTYSAFISPSTGSLFVGGNFNSEDADPFAPVPGEYIAMMDLATGQWSNLDLGITEALAGLEVMAIQEFQGEIYIGGNFIGVNNLKCRYLTAWDPNFGGWDILGNGTHDACDVVFDINQIGSDIVGNFDYMSGRYTPANAFRIPGNAWASSVEFKGNGYQASVHEIYRDSSLFWYAGAYDSVSLLTGDLTLAKGICQQDFIGLTTPLSTSLGGPGNFQTIYSASLWQGNLIVGGTFTSIDGVAANGLASKDANDNWSELAAIGGGEVRTIFNDGDSLLYIGGTFSTVNGTYIEGLAVYDGTNWAPLGQSLGFYHNVFSIAKDPLTGEIAVGGGFQTVTQSDGTTLNSAGLAFWDGTQWSSKGEVQATITSPAQYARIVRSIDFDENGVLYIGGEFSGVNGISAKRVARYTPGMGWEALGAGISGSDCAGYPVVEVVEHSFDKLYVGGQFSRAGEGQSHGFAVYDMSIATLALMPDTFDVSCDTTTIMGLPGFDNWQWSTGNTGPTAYVTGDYFDSLANENRRVWVYATAEKNGCIITDSIEVAYVGTDGTAVLEFGYFEQNDSTYIYWVPGYDTAYAQYDLWLIDQNIFMDSPNDTVAVKMPCMGYFEASVRMQMENCIFFLQDGYVSNHQRDGNLIDYFQFIDCGQMEVYPFSGYTNHYWSNISFDSVATIFDSFLMGQDSMWLYLEADTSWVNIVGDTVICRLIDSAQIIRNANFPTKLNQMYTYMEEDSFKVEFIPGFFTPNAIIDTWWEYGDGTGVQYFPVGDYYDALQYQYPQAGMYTVTVIASSDYCEDPGELDTVQFDIFVGTNSLPNQAKNPIGIVPNPSDGQFNIVLPEGLSGDLRITLLNSQGQFIYQQDEQFHRGGNCPIQLSKLPEGIYFLQVQLDDRQWMERVMIR